MDEELDEEDEKGEKIKKVIIQATNNQFFYDTIGISKFSHKELLMKRLYNNRRQKMKFLRNTDNLMRNTFNTTITQMTLNAVKKKQNK